MQGKECKHLLYMGGPTTQKVNEISKKPCNINVQKDKNADLGYQRQSTYYGRKQSDVTREGHITFTGIT